jgi:hypothetical protein
VKIGVGGTRVFVMSLGYGWIWFIPLGPTRTSIGLIVPADYYKDSGQSTEELYKKALAEEPMIAKLIANATSEGLVRATKDWSFTASRMTGENWFLVGESAGFADPILAAGMTLAQSGARELAFTILELDRGRHPAEWLKEQYDLRQKKRIGQHIKFANYWYTANGRFTDLQEYTREIAAEAGINAEAKQAWQWLGTGQFITEEDDFATFGGFTLDQVKVMHGLMTENWPEWELSKHNEFRLNLIGAVKKTNAIYNSGQVHETTCYVRGGSVLPMTGCFGVLFRLLQTEKDAEVLVRKMVPLLQKAGFGTSPNHALHMGLQSLEGMLLDGWVKGATNKKRPPFQLATYRETNAIHANRDPVTV